MNNPVRIADRQRKYIKFVSGRFTPVLQDRIIGINFLYDSDPNASGDFLVIGNGKDDSKMDIEPLQVVPEERPQDEVGVPEEFEYDEGKQLLDKKKDWGDQLKAIKYYEIYNQYLIISFKDGKKLWKGSRYAQQMVDDEKMSGQ